MPRRVLQGVVKNRSGDKSVRVLVWRTVKHAKYHKSMRLSSKYIVHDPENRCVPKQHVSIAETRPISKRKSWEVLYDVFEEKGEVNVKKEKKGA